MRLCGGNEVASALEIGPPDLIYALRSQNRSQMNDGLHAHHSPGQRFPIQPITFNAGRTRRRLITTGRPRSINPCPARLTFDGLRVNVRSRLMTNRVHLVQSYAYPATWENCKTESSVR